MIKHRHILVERRLTNSTELGAPTGTLKGLSSTLSWALASSPSTRYVSYPCHMLFTYDIVTSIPARINPEGSYRKIRVGKLIALTGSFVEGESRRLHI
jgi:hypothetical protein